MLVLASWVISCIVISVKADEDLNKYVLECSGLGQMLWKHKFPQDTEDEGKVRLSSKDEAEGMPLVSYQACHAVRPPASLVPSSAKVPLTSMPSSVPAAVGSAAPAAAAGGPGLDEMVVKKAALVMMKHVRWLL